MDRIREGEGAGEINVRREEVHETLSTMAPGRCTGGRWTRGAGPSPRFAAASCENQTSIEVAPLNDGFESPNPRGPPSARRDTWATRPRPLRDQLTLSTLLTSLCSIFSLKRPSFNNFIRLT